MNNMNIKFDKNIKVDNVVIAVIYFDCDLEKGSFDFRMNPIIQDKILENQELIQKELDDFKEFINKNLEFNKYPFKLF